MTCVYVSALRSDGRCSSGMRESRISYVADDGFLAIISVMPSGAISSDG